MPRFFFHVFDELTALDEEGRDLPSLDAARQAAMSGARDLMCEQLRKGRLVLHHHIEVEDESGARVIVMPFRDAAEIEP